MVNTIAYFVLIVIWSTTPIAIKWGAMDVSFAGAIFWRILISAVLALSILKLRGDKLFITRDSWRFYTVAAIGIAPNFLLVYWSSLWIPSGLISVIFSTVPFLMGVLSYYWLGKNVFTRQRVTALCIAVVGLVVIFYDQLQLIGDNGAYGMLTMVLSVICFAFSSTWMQKMGNHLPILHTTTGGLCFSLPPLAIVWWFLDGSFPWPVSLLGGLSIVYLGVVGSLIGFFLYYFLLHRLSAYVVSTVGMISPVFALMLGVWIAGEPMTTRLLIGAVMVLFALSLYHGQAIRHLFAKE